MAWGTLCPYHEMKVSSVCAIAAGVIAAISIWIMFAHLRHSAESKHASIQERQTIRKPDGVTTMVETEQHDAKELARASETAKLYTIIGPPTNLRHIASQIEWTARHGSPRERASMFRPLQMDVTIKRTDAIAILRKYLRDAVPYTRYDASKMLYEMGDNSGYDTLMEFVKSKTQVTDGDIDLRMAAAETLAKFRDTRATKEIANLYLAEHEAGIERAAVELGARQIVPEMLKRMENKQIYSGEIEWLGMLGASEAKPLIEAQFRNPMSSPMMKTQAAAALVRLGGGQPYVDYILSSADNFANKAEHQAKKEDYLAGRIAMRELGSLRSEEVRAYFEQALQSSDHEAAEIAFVNLIVNYPESKAAKDVLVASFGDSSSSVPFVTRLKLAAMSNDPAIRAAAEKSDFLSWYMYAVHQAGWSVEPWLRNFGAR